MDTNQIKFLLSLPPEEIVSWYKTKGLTVTWSWRDLWQEAHSRSFTVAKAMKLDILQSIKDEVDKIFDSGITYEQFKKDLEPILKRLGWWGKVKASDVPGYDPASGVDPNKIVQLGSPSRLKTIFRVNSSVGYNSLRYKNQWANRESRPYWWYIQLDRPTKRKAHEYYHNKVFLATDPIWAKIYPPNGWFCFPGETEVAVRNGWERIDNIKIGDTVLGGSGKYRLVNAVSKRKFNGCLVRFTTKNGSASSTPNHRVLTLNGWVRVENLKVGDVIVQIPEAAALDKTVGNINHSYAAVGDSIMPVPVERETSVCNALNSEFQFRDNNIDPIRRTIKIKNWVIANSFKMRDKFFLVFGRLKISVWMGSRVQCKIKKLRLAHLGSYFASFRRGFFSKFIGNSFNRFGIIFSKSKSWVFMSLPMLLHKLADKYGLFPFSFIGVNPLCFNSFTAVPGFDTEVLEQSHYSSSVHFPSSFERIVPEKFFDVEEPEGFAGGAPLDLFDSLQSFQTWAGLHCYLSKILSVANIQYTGNVFNLEVDKDETYVVKPCVVHNCMCSVRALTKEEFEQRKLKLYEGSTMQIITDEGWDYNPGKTAFKPDLTKYNKELVAQYLKS